MVQVGPDVTAPTNGKEGVPLRSRLWQLMYRLLVVPGLTALDWLWRALVWIVASFAFGGLLVNAIVSWLTTGTLGLSDPRTWPVSQPILQHPEVGWALGGATLCLVLLAYLGHRARGRVLPPSLRAYHVGRVSRILPQDFLKNFHPFYLPRRLDRSTASQLASALGAPGEADAATRGALQAARRRSLGRGSADPVGVCVYGRDMLGTTRLAWEAMKAELGSSTFMVWPESAPVGTWDQLLRILQRRRAKVVVWLDDLGKYANSPGLIPYINTLPGWIEAYGIPFLIIATCHEQQEVGPLHQHFAPLLQRLAPITPAPISLEEARSLAAALARSGREIEFDERAFDGLPGSIVFGVSRMRDEVYPNLGQAAQLVLKTVKLLRSAGISPYTEQRVTIVARDVFGLNLDQIPAAIEAVQRAGFLQAGSPTAEGQPTLAPGVEVYLDVAVPDYPHPVDAASDWPLLQGSLERIRDGRALARLGDTFRERQDYAHAEKCYEVALPTFRRDAAPLERASLQYGLGLVLIQHASQVEEPEARARLLERAQDNLNSVLRVVNQQNDPVMWRGALEGWREVLRRRPKTTGTPARLAGIERALVAARKEANAAKAHGPAAWAEALLNVGILLFLQARLEREASARWNLLVRALATHEQALAAITAEVAPLVWARAQGSLGDVARARADAAHQPLRGEYLARAAEAYDAALRVPVPERSRRDVAELWLGRGEALHALAAAKEPEARADLLAQAGQALRQAVTEYEKGGHRIEEAEVQCLLARVLGDLATRLDGAGRIDALTRGLIEYEYAMGVLDPQGNEWGDEIRVRMAELLWKRAEARLADSAVEEGKNDLRRVAPLCDNVVKRDGMRERDLALYRLANRLRRDAQAKLSAVSTSSTTLIGVNPLPASGETLG